MRKLVSGALLVVLVLVWFAGVGGSQSSGITRAEVGRGGVGEPYTVSGDKGSDVVVQTVRIEPGGSSGWHTHPGPEVAIVKSGRLILFDGTDSKCRSEVFTAGQTFARQGHIHLGKNAGNEPVEIVVTYFNVPPGGPAAVAAGRPKQCSEE
jgi:quercetin dioxygenase-like cupin family protein